MTIGKTPAIWWDCRGEERLSHESPEDAIIDLFDCYVDFEGPLTEEEIAKHCPLEVLGHAPAIINSNYVYSCAESAVERFEESLSEDYGDPEGDYRILTDNARQDLTERLFGLFSDAVKTVTSWSCDVVEKRVYTAEQISAMLRKECPKWFEENV